MPERSTRSRCGTRTTGTSTCAMERCSPTVLPFTARQFARAIVMPNLPPVTPSPRPAPYRERIGAALPEDSCSVNTFT